YIHIMSNKKQQQKQQQQEDAEYIDPNDTAQEVLLETAENSMMDDDDDMNNGDHNDDEDDDQDEDEDFVDESVQGFFDHKESVYCVSINGQHQDVIATGGGDDLAYLWSVGDGKMVHKLEGHKDSVSSIEFNFDGSLVATGGMDGTVKVWDVATGKQTVTLEGPSESVEWIKWHPRGNVLIAGASDCMGFLWSTLKGDLMSTFSGHSAPLTAGNYTPDGKRVVTVSEDGTLRVWNPKDGSMAGVIQGHGFHEGPISTLAIRSDGVLAITGGEDHFACISNINTFKTVGRLMGHTDTVEAVAFSNTNPNFAITGSMDGTVRVWDVNSQQPRTMMKHKSGTCITKIIVHPTQPIVYSSSTDKTICLWDERNGQLIKQFPGHQDSILDFDITRDGSTIVTAGDDKVSLVFSMFAQTAQPNATVSNTTQQSSTTTTM
ncbi:hypothetical protein SAMD00019534_008120, partial [Acytostelium subglobosum LB1]|uniref:hypothetical protein n=1 Tax=Acytostelium subglobosum LB1 TaxID=1410327 RepID=UPI000644DC79